MQMLLPNDRHSASAANTLLKTWSDQISYLTEQDWALSCQGVLIEMCLWLQKGILYQMLQKKKHILIRSKKAKKHWLRKGSMYYENTVQSQKFIVYIARLQKHLKLLQKSNFVALIKRTRDPVPCLIKVHQSEPTYFVHEGIKME